jgi:DNA-binding MarR family transcriptional regulator
MTHTNQAIGRFRDLIARAYQSFNALQRGEKRCFGVTMSQCFTLELLHQRGRVTVRELAAGLGLDTSTVTRTIDVLARDGMVRRDRDERGDRRRVFLSLTARGRALAAKLARCADGYSEKILQQLPKNRIDDVLRALQVLVDAMEEMPETGNKAA